MTKILLFLILMVNLSVFAALLYEDPVTPECISPAQERRMPESPVLHQSPPRFWAL